MYTTSYCFLGTMLRRICRCKSCGEDGRAVSSNEYSKHHASSRPCHNLLPSVLTMVHQRAAQVSEKYARRATALKEAEALPPLTAVDLESRFGQTAPSSQRASPPSIQATSSFLKAHPAEVEELCAQPAIPRQSQEPVATLHASQLPLVRRGDVDVYDTCK